MNLWQDVRFGARLLVKDYGFSLAAIAVLALGIALNTTIFTLVNAVLLRGVPFPEADRLAAIVSSVPQDLSFSVSLDDFEDVREASTSFEEIGYWVAGTFNLSDEGRPPDRYQGPYISVNTFDLIGEQPILGRGFRPEDDEPGAPPVVLIGHSIWTNRYGGDPSVLGRTVRVNGLAATVIGVMREGMRFPPNSDIWVPMVHTADVLKGPRDQRIYNTLARLKDGVTMEQAAAEIEAVGLRLAHDHPDTNDGIKLTAIPYADRVNGEEIVLIFWSMMGAVLFVLLIACTNVANLSLARSTRRVTEIRVRASLGATRGRVVRQLLIESVMLATAGGVVGLGLSLVGIRLFDLATTGVGKPYFMEFTLDPIVFGFLALVCLGTGITFGLVPALQVSKTNVYGVLKDGGRSNTGGHGARRWAGVLVTAQMALTVVLLAGAGFMVRSLLKVSGVDLNVDTGSLVTAQVTLPGRDYPDTDAQLTFYRRAEERLAALGGIEAAAFTSNLPMGGGGARPLTREGDPPVATGQRRPAVTTVGISPGYFDALGLPLIRGRGLTAMDGEPGYENVVVNQRFVAQHFPGADPLGRRIRFEQPEAEEAPPWLTIVGIVPNVRQRAVQETDTDPIVYLPLRMQAGFGASLLLRSPAPLASVAAAARQATREIDPDLPLYNLRTLDQYLVDRRWTYTVIATTFAIFAFIALVLSAVGLYAITAYSVSQRTPEVGLRMALGAQPGQVWWMFLRRSVIQTGIGLALGLAGAAGVGRLLQRLLFQIGPNDPVTFAAIALTLGAVATASFVWPVRRAIAIDPVAALRYE